MALHLLQNIGKWSSFETGKLGGTGIRLQRITHCLTSLQGKAGSPAGLHTV